MAQVAAKKLITSKGTIKTGEDIPAGLSADEVKAIGEAGGILDYKPRGRAGKDGGAKDADRAAAEKAVKDAEALVAAATTEEERLTAQGLLDEARASVGRLV